MLTGWRRHQNPYNHWRWGELVSLTILTWHQIEDATKITSCIYRQPTHKSEEIPQQFLVIWDSPALDCVIITSCPICLEIKIPKAHVNANRYKISMKNKYNSMPWCTNVQHGIELGYKIKQTFLKVGKQLLWVNNLKYRSRCIHKITKKINSFYTFD